MMRRYLTIITIVIMTVIALLFLYDNKSTAPSPHLSNTEANQQVTTAQTDSEMAVEGRYLNYGEEQVSKSLGTRILFFHAPWCPQCRQLEADIKSGDIPSGVTIFKVDYDSHQDLRRKYGVTIQTTLVKLNENGSMDKKFVAYDKPTLQNVVENLLK